MTDDGSGSTGHNSQSSEASVPGNRGSFAHTSGKRESPSSAAKAVRFDFTQEVKEGAATVAAVGTAAAANVDSVTEAKVH